jgi:hypothetical protein
VDLLLSALLFCALKSSLIDTVLADALEQVRQEITSSIETPPPTLTSGQTILPTAAATSSHEHGLGIPDEPQSTPSAFFSTVTWDSAVLPTATFGPPAPPPGEEATNFTSPLDKRVLPDVVDWRSRWGFNWITSIQVSPHRNKSYAQTLKGR